MKPKNLIAKLIVGTCLAVSPLLTGCENPFSPEFDHKATEGHANVAGTWYKPESGISGNWKYHWGYLYLEQKGTEVKGMERWEQYNPVKISGFVDGNHLHLTKRMGEHVKHINGTVEGDVFDASYTSTSVRDGSQINIKRIYTRINDDIPDEYYDSID